MKIRCAWCQEIIGEKEPMANTGITDTICPACEAKFFPEKHKHEFKIYYNRKISYQKGRREYFVWQPKISYLCVCGEGRVIKW